MQSLSKSLTKLATDKKRNYQKLTCIPDQVRSEALVPSVDAPTIISLLGEMSDLGNVTATFATKSAAVCCRCPLDLKFGAISKFSQGWKSPPHPVESDRPFMCLLHRVGLKYFIV